MADGNITKDIMYDAVAPDDFESMIELDRYEKRSTAFDRLFPPPTIISGTRSTRSTSTSPSRGT